MSIKLKSNDGQEIEISQGAASKSEYLKREISKGNKTIELEDIKGEVLSLVVEYLQHYENKDFAPLPEVLKTNDLNQELEKWDADFISKPSFETAFNLINAAVTLELEKLHDLACTKIAAFMKGKSPDEVNKEFTIECQLTQEEAKELGLEGS